MAHDEDPARARDAALLAAYAAGDHSAARTLVSEHAPRVLALARRMLTDEAEAEDVAQEAMMRLWKIAPSWRAGEARESRLVVIGLAPLDRAAVEAAIAGRGA